MANVPQRRLTRSSHRWVAGVCAGIAEYFSLPAWFVRLVFAVSTLALGILPGVAAYGVLWLVLPPAWPSA